VSKDTLRHEIEELRQKLARLEDLQRRQDHETWLQFQRERQEAIKAAETVSPRL
jgi:hypothetical protein